MLILSEEDYDNAVVELNRLMDIYDDTYDEEILMTLFELNSAVSSYEDTLTENVVYTD